MLNRAGKIRMFPDHRSLIQKGVGMAVENIGLKKHLSTALFLLFFAGTVFLNTSCESDDNPVDEDCGVGQKSWDSKAGVCRDQDNKILDPSCCGQ